MPQSVVSSLAEPDTVTLERSEDGQMTISSKHLGKKQLQVRAAGDSSPTFEHGGHNIKRVINAGSISLAAQGTEVQKVDNAEECCISEEQALILGRAALEVSVV